MENKFHQELRRLTNEFVHKVYDVSIGFPKDEIFGVTSQLRRAALSIMLNYVEGYARQRKAVLKNFLEISYGSAQECKCLVQFCYERKYISKENYDDLMKMVNKIGAMLWGILNKI